MKQTMAIELDGTICMSFQDMALEWYNDYAGKNETSQNFWLNIWPFLGPIFKQNMLEQEFLYTQRSMRGFDVGVLRELMYVYDVAFVTDKRSTVSDRNTRSWFRYNGLEVESIFYVSSIPLFIREVVPDIFIAGSKRATMLTWHTCKTFWVENDMGKDGLYLPKDTVLLKDFTHIKESLLL